MPIASGALVADPAGTKLLKAYSGRIPNVLLRRLADDSHVKRVHLDRDVTGEMARTTATVGALTAHLQYGYTGAGIGVAVIDSGITSWHDDLGASAFSKTGQRVTKFVDFVNNQTSEVRRLGSRHARRRHHRGLGLRLPRPARRYRARRRTSSR